MKMFRLNVGYSDRFRGGLVDMSRWVQRLLPVFRR
jgi:hypothetical protein